MNLTTESQREKIKEIISIELLKRGINVSLVVEEKGNRIDLSSSLFQTTPVIFKEMFIYAFGSWITQKENFVEVHININVRFSVFNGGSNGTELFKVVINCFDDEARLVNCI